MTISERSLDRAREQLWRIRDEERAARYTKARSHMSKRKTPFGDQVDKPHPTSGTRDRLDSLFESATGVLDEVMAASQRESAIASTETSDRRRFPVLGGE